MIIDLEYKLFCLVNKACAHPALDLVMPLITVLGSGEFIFALSMILLFAVRKKEKKVAGLLLLAGLTLSYYFVYFFKNWIARPRPPFVFADVHIVGTVEKSSSFPSGHAAVAFMAAVILSRYYRHALALFFGLAGLVALSRVYLGMHFVTDVVSGAALGSIIGYALARVTKQ